MDFPSLPERPEAHALTVEDILTRAKSGRIRVPRLQRGLRWEKKHVIELFDSILRGYPIGSLLVSQDRADADPSLSFGPKLVSAPEAGDVWWLIDGQQRVTSLVAALLHPDEDPVGNFAVWVDLKSGVFEIPRKPLGPGWLPLNVIGDRTRLHKWSRSANFGEDTDALVERAFDIESTLTRYNLTAFVVRQADERTVRAIFARVNDSGVRIEQHEVVDALFGEQSRGKPLDTLVADLNRETAFGEIDKGWLLRCLKAIERMDPTARFDERNQLSDDLLSRAKAALRKTIQLLQLEAAIPHSAVLPYRFPLLVLAPFFERYPHPSPRNRELLVRWVWRGALSQAHARSSDADLRAHLRDLDEEEDEDIAVGSLLARVPKVFDLPDPSQGWHGKSAFTRLYAVAMIERGPLDPTTQAPVLGFSQILSRPLGEVFIEPAGPTGTIASRVFWPFSRESLGEADPEILASLFIDERAAGELARGSAEGFAQAREESLFAYMTWCLARYAAPHADDRPSIATILSRAGR